ncbi:MAG: hypothetical protein ACPHK4_01560 [Candidatus Puniceispirillaceae bacterium]
MGTATKILIAIFGGVFTLALMLGIYYVLIPSFSENLEPVKIIDVEIRLKNECSVTDAAFIVEAPQQRKRSKFFNGFAVMRLPENAKVKLSVSPAFPDFTYDGVPELVSPNMVLVADCGVSPRLKSIFGAMKDQFGE